MSEWLKAVETELGLSSVVDDQQGLTAIVDVDGRVREHTADEQTGR